MADNNPQNVGTEERQRRSAWVAAKVTTLLDWGYRTRAAAGHLFVYLSIRLIGIEPTLDEVKNAYAQPKRELSIFSEAQVPECILETAKDCYKASSDRRSYIIDKCKSLLTLASLFLGLFSYVLPKGASYQSDKVKCLVGVTIYLLVHAVLLLLLFFDVKSGQEIALTKDIIPLGEQELKISLAEAYYDSKQAIDDGTNYLVDLYKAARFFVFAALFVASGLFYFGFVTQSVSDPVRDFAKSVRGDAELIKILQGPQGVPGPTGHRGEAGISPKIDIDQLSKKVKDKIKQEEHLCSCNLPSNE